MSKTVDERVVEMRFDNQNFENNVKTSMSTLDRLKQSLKLTDAGKGLENINSSVKGFDMSPMGNAVETVRTKFSALEVMAVTALANITNSAVNTGKRLISAFTIEPIKTGLQEYETQINAVQTILANTASKGTNLEQVNAALDELNLYADKTIYNFTEMTRNIGTFTAAGIDLDTSVNAIQGIANLAAVSGSTSQQASTAMYQLSQALATGTIRLMDWNSVVNAGMGGQVFQDALKKTSEELGTGAEAAIKAEGSFRESLQTGWLTSEVLTETLKKFTTSGANEYVAEYCGISADAVQAALDAAEAQYGEADAIDKAAEALANKTGKNKDEIKSALEFAKTAEDAATKVKTFSQLMDTLKEAAQSGWSQTWRILIGDFEEAKSLWTSASDYFGNAIVDMSNARNEILQEWADAGGRTMAIEAIKNAFSGLLSIIRPVKEAFKEVFPAVTAQQLLSITEKIRDLTAKFKLSETQAAGLKAAFKGVFSVIKVGLNIITTLVGGVIKLASNFGFLVTGVLTIAGAFGKFVSKVSEAISKSNLLGGAINALAKLVQNGVEAISGFFDSLGKGIDTSGFEAFKNVLSSIFDFIRNLATNIKDALSNMFDFENITAGLKALNAGILTGILLGIKKFITSFTEKINDIPGIVDNVKSVLDSVRDSLEVFQRNLQANTLKKIAIAVGILAASILILSTIDPAKLSSALGAITILFVDLAAAMSAISKIEVAAKGLTKLSTAMIAISAAVLILASAVRVMGSLSWGELARGLVGTVVLLGAVVGASILLSSFGGKIKKGALQIVILAAAIKILASACMDLAGLSWTELAKGLLGVGVLLNAVAIFMNNSKFSLKALPTAIGILAIAAAIKVLASAAADFGSMKWSEIRKGLVAIGALLAELALFTNLTGNAKKVLSTAAALIVIASAIKILASAMVIFAELSWKEIGKGLTAMGGALLEIGIAMALLPKDMAITAVGLVIVASALVILANAFAQMGGMSWKEIGKGLIVLGGSMLILAIGLNAMNGTLAGSAALIIAASAIAILTLALTALGSMSLAEIGKSLLVLAGAFAVIGVAAALLTPLIPALLGLSIALALFGAACLAVGAGITLLGVGLTSLAAIVPAHIASIIASFVLLVEGLGVIIVAICDSIVASASSIGEAIKTLILTLVDVIVECAPAIADGALTLLDEVLAALIEHGPEIAESLFTLFVGVIGFLTEKAQELTDVLVDFIIAVIQGISNRIGDILAALATLLESIIQGLVAIAGPIIENIIGPLVEIIINVFSQILESLSTIITSITGLVQQLGDSISQVFLAISVVISTCGTTICNILTSIGQVINEVFSGISEVITSIGDSIRTVLDGIAGIFDSIGKAALNAGKGFEKLANGVKTITELNLADMAASLATVATGLGKIASKSDDLKTAADGIKSISTNIKTVSSSFASINTSAASAITSINSIGTAMSSAASTISKSGSTISSAMSKIMKSIKTSITSSGASIKTSFTAVFTKALASVKGMSSKFSSAGKELVNKMVTGMNSAKSKISSTISTMMSSVVTKIKSYKSNFTTAGEYLGEGLVSGINSKKTAAYNAGYALGKAAVQGEKDGQKSKSPSKLTMQAGKWFGEGLVIGINKMGTKVYNAGYDLGATAVDSLSNSISNIATLLSDDVDMEPTIRPVLDLDDVKSGISAIDGMFDFGPSIGVMANTGAISSMMNGIQNGASNDDVVSAIGDLGRKISDMSSPTYNINGITYDDGTNVSNAVKSLIRAARVERRV